MTRRIAFTKGRIGNLTSGTLCSALQLALLDLTFRMMWVPFNNRHGVVPHVNLTHLIKSEKWSQI